MHRSPDQHISNGLVAFANGMRLNRMQREAYRQAAFEGRDRDAQNRVIARLQAQVQAERRRNVALEARLIADAISASLRG